MDAYPLDEHDLCTVCRESQVNFDAAYSYGSYDGPLRDLIHLFKYSGIESMAGPLSRLMVRALPRDERFDLVLPVPMHWLKRWRRGFNQAELLAKPVARHLGVPLTRNLCRKRRGHVQAGLNHAERLENLKNVFSVSAPGALAGKRVLLIDDVFTTGATLRAAAGVLREAGALRICAMTLARVDRRLKPASGSDRDRGRKARRAAASQAFPDSGGSELLDGEPFESQSRREADAKSGPTT